MNFDLKYHKEFNSVLEKKQNKGGLMGYGNKKGKSNPSKAEMDASRSGETKEETKQQETKEEESKGETKGEESSEEEWEDESIEDLNDALDGLERYMRDLYERFDELDGTIQENRHKKLVNIMIQMAEELHSLKRHKLELYGKAIAPKKRNSMNVYDGQLQDSLEDLDRINTLFEKKKPIPKADMKLIEDFPLQVNGSESSEDSDATVEQPPYSSEDDTEPTEPPPPPPQIQPPYSSEDELTEEEFPYQPGEAKRSYYFE